MKIKHQRALASILGVLWAGFDAPGIASATGLES